MTVVCKLTRILAVIDNISEKLTIEKLQLDLTFVLEHHLNIFLHSSTRKV